MSQRFVPRTTRLARTAVTALALAALMLGAACESQTAKKGEPRPTAVGPAEKPAQPTLAPSPAKGPETAPVTLVEISEFQ